MRRPEVGLFVREDLERPENRINVSLFHSMSVPEFRAEFLRRLGLPSSCVVFPPQNVTGEGGSIRPDLCVCNHGEVIAWIEVELGSDRQQLDRFRRELTEPVIAIWGSPAPAPSLQLTDLGQLARELIPRCPEQQALALEHLARAIEDGIGGHSRQIRTDVSDKMASTGFLAALDELVGGVKRIIRGYNPPGFLYSNAVSEIGFSIRVSSTRSRASDGTVGVLNRSAGRPYLEFNSRKHLIKYLPEKASAVEQLAELVRPWGADLNSESRRGRRVPLAIAEDHVSEIAEALRRLA